MRFSTDQYSWSDVTIQIGNRVLTGVQGISYKRTQEKGYVYGKGNKPLSIQRGNYAFDGSVRILQSELELLIQAAPDSDLMKYRNLILSVAYQNEGGEVIVDNIIGVEFMDVEKAIDQGKLQMEVNLPFIFLDVQYNI